jgi:hypothetical protein
MSWFSKITGIDAARNRKRGKADFWRNNGGDPNERFDRAIIDEGTGAGWQTAFNQSAGAAYNRMMPQFREQLQLTREDGIRRGISTGDLGTSYEGDLASAFSQNLADTFGSMAMSGYENSRNRYLDLLTGRLDRNQAARNARTANWMGAGRAAASVFSGGA